MEKSETYCWKLHHLLLILEEDHPVIQGSSSIIVMTHGKCRGPILEIHGRCPSKTRVPVTTANTLMEEVTGSIVVLQEKCLQHVADLARLTQVTTIKGTLCHGSINNEKEEEVTKEIATAGEDEA